MKVKELKISPVPEDKKFSKIYAHIILITPILPIIILSVLAYLNQEVLKDLYPVFLENKVFLIIFFIFWFGGMLNMSRETLNYLLTEEICSVESKTFYYQKFRRAFGMRKLMKSLEIPLLEIVEVKEVKKPSIIYYFLNPVSHRNSVEIETRDGKKYKIMNSIVFGNRNTQNPTSEITSQRANKIYNDVKDMISK
ncbi:MULTISPECIES: hypothetical protein [Fusobacterium]|uniref:Uncharacterized protein n=1 Tax=Fusobacterium nucleatum subsp. polymorphum TaxID=76857 RepID=A0A1Z3CHX5_FUSNP|nr:MULTISPECIES: hypothetical protein [Fusobacterium]BEO91073.1 hypothetical protein FNCP4_02850 [Fusobacterium nucleatum]ASC03237.1 hypothetical protein CBG50_07990 [Fusobacterium polymorphum]EUB12577.1 hypothetical protein HMPREF1500_0063 [Fusobacterium sp. CM22]PHI12030.1 hypothetical protein CBG58_09565 [Fusobacterium polymorphum]BEP03146.1 hypothetical protein FNSP4_08800 [Fusobacterium nucleatum]